MAELLDHYLNLIERNLVLGTIVKLSRPRRLVRCDLLSVFERAAVLEIGPDSGCPKSMAASGVGEAGGLGPPLDPIEFVTSGQGIGSELVALFEAAK
jgi:hypothetical protein